MNVVLLPCPGCGAGLPVDPEHSRVTCIFCSADTHFPPDRFTAHRALPTRVEAIEGEGLLHLERELRDHFAPGYSGTLFAIGLGTGLPVLAINVALFGAAAVSLVSRGDHTDSAIGIACLAGPPIGFLVAIAWLVWRGLARPRATRALEALRTAVQDVPRKSRCPGCGGPVAVPSATAVVACPSCEAPLIVSDGMLVQWVDDARKRREAWKAEAKEVAKDTYAWERRWIDAAGLLSMVPTAVLMAVLVLCGGAVKSAL